MKIFVILILHTLILCSGDNIAILPNPTGRYMTDYRLQSFIMKAKLFRIARGKARGGWK